VERIEGGGVEETNNRRNPPRSRNGASSTPQTNIQNPLGTQAPKGMGCRLGRQMKFHSVPKRMLITL
jgi:hypothetical protein